jgi:hypothetical protein
VTGRAQPKPGDVLVGCVHRPTPGGAHVFHVPDGVPVKKVTRTGRTTLVARWIMLCDSCFRLYGGGVLDAPIGCDHTWTETDPPIRYMEPS